MPQTHQTHKSMLLRGANLPPPALTPSDVEVIRGKSRRGVHGGPGYGGGQYNNYNGDRRRGPPRAPSNFAPQAPTWRPPPPGGRGFGIGVPPPPPAYGGYQNHPGNGYNNVRRW
jgi:5'-3' exoribonuclease 2